MVVITLQWDPGSCCASVGIGRTGGSQAYTRFPIGSMLLHVTANSYTISLVTRGRSAGPVGFAACGIYHGVERIRVFARGRFAAPVFEAERLRFASDAGAAGCLRVGVRVRFALCLLPSTSPSTCRGVCGGNLLTVSA